MTAEALGSVLSEHVHTWVYRGLATVIALPLFAFCLFMATNQETVAFLTAAGVTAVSWLVYVSWQARERLILHEHGLRIESPLGTRIVLWQDLRDFSVYHSFVVEDPHAIYVVILERGDGRKLKFRMNWTDRKTLLKHLLPHLQRRSLEDFAREDERSSRQVEHSSWAEEAPSGHRECSSSEDEPSRAEDERSSAANEGSSSINKRSSC